MRSFPRWWRAERRRSALEEPPGGAAETYFGFEPVAAEEKTARMVRHFDAVAPVYDRMNTLLSFGIHHAWKRQAVRMLGLRPGMRVLDVCGGTGDLSLLAARRVAPRGRVILYDLNRRMILAGLPKLRRSREGAFIRPVQGNAEEIACRDGSVDAVMVGFGIRNVTRMRRAFAEMHRVLRPGGRLLCLEFSRPTPTAFRLLYDFYSFRVMPRLGEWIAGNRQAYTHLPESIRTFPLPGELAGLLRGVGFREVRWRPFTRGIAVAHLARK
ncbi:MAG: class I SAM-dependent methyltransferase [Desulfobacterales bacterium]